MVEGGPRTGLLGKVMASSRCPSQPLPADGKEPAASPLPPCPEAPPTRGCTGSLLREVEEAPGSWDPRTVPRPRQRMEKTAGGAGGPGAGLPSARALWGVAATVCVFV